MPSRWPTEMYTSYSPGCVTGANSPTVNSLEDPDWCSVKVMVKRSAVIGIMEQLEALGASAILETHEERAEWAIYFAVGLLVVAVIQAIQHRIESRATEPKRALTVVAAVLAIVVGGWATVGVVLIGDAGAQAVWGERE